MDPVEELRLLKYKASTIKAKEMTEVFKKFLIINNLFNNKLFRNMECTHFSYEKNKGSINSYMVYTYDLKIRLADRLNNIDISVLISDEENYNGGKRRRPENDKRLKQKYLLHMSVDK